MLRPGERPMKTYWEYYSVSYDSLKKISDELDLPIIIARILVNRGYETPEEARRFVDPHFEDLYDPFLMKGMETAVERILKAIENNEKICIYGDYDVDGVTSIIILRDALDRLGASVTYTIPNRLDEGYGLNHCRLEEHVLSDDTRLIITVDTGTTSCEEADFIHDHGIDLIITDHHEEGTEIPRALTILNPKVSGVDYPYKELAGVGVIFKLIQALDARAEKKLPLTSYLKIAAIGTIADIVPLIDENRIIAKLGLNELSGTTNMGMRTLFSELRLENRELEASDISFRLAPRINALGRLGNVGQAVELFFTHNRAYAREIVQEMNRLNSKRQKLENDIYKHAINLIENDPNFEDKPVIVIQGEDWHLGVIGIVASRLANKYYKPSLVISHSDGIGKASGRSIPGFDLKGSLDMEADLLESFGGHKMAVGFQIKIENIPEFMQRVNKRVKKILDGHLFIREDKVDADIALQSITPEFMTNLDKLKPFGHSNPKPVFQAKNVKIAGSPQLIKSAHVKMKFEQHGAVIEGIVWKKPEWYEELKAGDSFNIIFHINKNHWYGEETIQLELKDFEVCG